MEIQEKEQEQNAFKQMTLFTPQQLAERSEKGALVVGVEFTEEEKARIDKLAQEIDISDRVGLITYGAGAQDKLTKFSNDRLSQTSTSKLDEAGEALTNLIVILQTYNPSLEKNPPKNMLLRWAKQKKQTIEETYEAAKAQLSTVSANLDKAESVLRDEHLATLTSRITSFEELYSIVSDIYRELSMYIAAGQQSLEYAKKVLLPQYDAKAQETQDDLDAQKLAKFAKAINTFEGNLYVLESSRQLCIYNGAFINQLQDKYLDTAQQIRQFISQATPQWRIQMNLSLSVQDLDSAQHALDAARDFTAQLFLTTAEQLRDLTVKTTLNANKPIVPTEVSVQVNDIYIDTMNKQLEAYRQNMSEVREGRRINYEMEEKRNKAMREFAEEAAKIAVENAYISTDPSKPNIIDESEQGKYYKVEEIQPWEIPTATGDTPSNPPKKYTL